MTAEHHGHTKSGTPLTDELIEKLADEAEAGYDVDEILGRRGNRGRPALGSGPSTVEDQQVQSRGPMVLVHAQRPGIEGQQHAVDELRQEPRVAGRRGQQPTRSRRRSGRR